jgi:hypothetical protein
VSADSVVHARLCLALLCCIEAAEHQWGVRARRSDDTDVTGSGAAVPRDKGAARRRRPTLPDEGQDQRPLLRHPHDGTAAGLGTLLIKRKGHAVQGRSLVSWSSARANLNCCCTVDSIYPTVFRPGSSPNNWQMFQVQPCLVLGPSAGRIAYRRPHCMSFYGAARVKPCCRFFCDRVSSPGLMTNRDRPEPA